VVNRDWKGDLGPANWMKRSGTAGLGAVLGEINGGIGRLDDGMTQS
jgi:hypothetical protein